VAGRVLLFAVQVVPLFAFFLWLYPKVIPVYESWVLAGVNAGYRAWSVPLMVRHDEAQGGLTAYISLSGGVSEPLVTDHTPETVFVGLVLLPTLLLATPIELRRRMLLLLVGLSLMYSVHALCVGFLFHELLLFRRGQTGPLSDWLLAWILTSGQVTAVVLWALLTGGHWFPRALGAARFHGSGRKSRNAPCPCGSPRKYKHCCGRVPS
jgi:hypothetical protein